MEDIKFKAINLIADTFDKHNIKYDVVYSCDSGREQLLAYYQVTCGPSVAVRFISSDNDNDVAVRIFGLVSAVPEEKRNRVMKACNVLNNKVRYVKFSIDDDGDINAEYDFPMHSSDDAIGEMAVEIVSRMMIILDNEYSIFMKALYSEEKLDIQKHEEPTGRFQEFRKKWEARMAAAYGWDGDSCDAEFEELEPNSETEEPADGIAQ